MRPPLCSLFLISLGACATATTGAYLPSSYDAAAPTIAQDAASKLAREYPPDEHRLEVVVDTQGTFDRAFASSLRRSGFAVAATSNASGEPIVVRYAVDRLRGTKLVRVTLFIDNRTLSRAYASQPSGVYPAGPWSSGVHRGS